MKRKILFQIFTLGLFLSFSACHIANGEMEEEDPASGQWLAYSETQCSDPWGYCNKSQDKRVCVSEYVQKQGYTIADISISQQSDDMYCKACNCPTGRVIKVKVLEQDVAKLLAAGFKKI